MIISSISRSLNVLQGILISPSLIPSCRFPSLMLLFFVLLLMINVKYAVLALASLDPFAPSYFFSILFCLGDIFRLFFFRLFLLLLFGSCSFFFLFLSFAILLSLFLFSFVWVGASYFLVLVLFFWALVAFVLF